MANIRQTIAPANTAGLLNGTTTLNDISAKVEPLYRYALIPLINVAGSNTITANCRVPLLVAEAGNQFQFLPFAANTGAVTLNIDARGAKPLRDASGVAVRETP